MSNLAEPLVEVANSYAYPLLAIDPSGFTQLIESAAYWDAFPIGFVGIFRRCKESIEFFSQSGIRYRLQSIDPSRRLSLFQRFFGGVRPTKVISQLRIHDRYDADSLRVAFLAALSSDDDILTQFHDRKSVASRLRVAKSIDTLFDVYRWTRKD